MPEAVTVTIHRSQWPDKVRQDLLHSLRARRLNHKFLYDSSRQTQKWLRLHEAYSPARRDADCRAVYESSFQATAKLLSEATRVQVLGLGCGGGQKDLRLMQLLQHENRAVFYAPCDVSTSMVLVACQTALAALPAMNCYPVVCDLLSTSDLGDLFKAAPGSGASRIVTFFGMIPNFEPGAIVPQLASLLARGDHLQFSANLAPGPDYAFGMEKVLPLYDNELTRDWLLTFLDDCGVARNAGQLRFVIEDCPNNSGLKRIAGDFQLRQRCSIHIDEDAVHFEAGESMRLFFSYRHTPSQIRDLLRQYGLQVLDQWITKSEEEGVFLCQRAP